MTNFSFSRRILTERSKNRLDAVLSPLMPILDFCQYPAIFGYNLSHVHDIDHRR